jgi:hypothetical protein
MDPDQPAHPRSLIRIHAVRLQTLLQVEKLIANSVQAGLINAGRKPIMLVLSWHGSFIYSIFIFVHCADSYFPYDIVYSKNFKKSSFKTTKS